MAGEDTTTRRAAITAAVNAIKGAGSKNDLIEAIDKAIGVTAPLGNPAVIEAAAQACAKAAEHCRHEVEEPVERAAKKSLPQAWEGMASVTAQDVVLTAARTAEQLSEALVGGQKALVRLADGLRVAQETDRRGREALHRARSMLGGEDGFFDDMVEKDAEEAEKERAREIATDGGEARKTAAQEADDAARATARDLNKLAAEARSGKLTGNGLSPVDKMMLADTAMVDEVDKNNKETAEREYNEILSANDLERSSTRLNGMNAADRAEFQRMLDGADKPEQRAYLMKALAAGHDMDELRKFDRRIDGKSEAWLARHLTPVVTEVDASGKPIHGTMPNNFKGDQGWTQGGDGKEASCVAASTVNARAMVDPVYALGLTGGPNGQEDSEAAFRDRLVDEQHRVHDEGDGERGGFFGNGPPTGMGDEGWSEVADNELNSPTGADYERQDLSSADDRRGVLPEIEQSVAEGKPVPIKTVGEGGHALVIVGHEGGKLQVHNPWGETTWVSENDFVNGNMHKASDSRFPDATGVHLPK
ncbi:peptidoglycan-binding protein [Streptomyces boluensis]|uniref:Peptidoglycan-binding protein n=1 Tax=Streptomyces boluensis TaxID=1775135 RepID=A0A964XL96_9ACTN|nr:peptidoglycan-binding protein [Streptomyces boluensis]NBE51368.1 peptidoglycan-binding protein [Streptomyces boluensis]